MIVLVMLAVSWRGSLSPSRAAPSRPLMVRRSYRLGMTNLLRGGCSDAPLLGGQEAAALRNQGAAALRKQAVTEIMAELFQQADAGNSTAMMLLGCCVSEGFNKKCKDAELAFRCFLSAAQNGDIDAHYNLGLCYATGRGVRQDQFKVTKWLRSTAEAGDTEAMRLLTIRMSEGRGCACDLQGATATFVRAAESGDPTSEFNLGVRYASGHGVPTQNLAQATAFYFGGGQDAAKEGPVGHLGAVVPDGWDDLSNSNSNFEDEEDRSRTRIAVEWYKRAASRGHCRALYNLAQLMAVGKGVPLSQDGATGSAVLQYH